MSWVNLSKAIHWSQAINKMPFLTELHLSYTQLPTISISHNNSSKSLAVLDLSDNGLTSSIYPWLFNLFSTSSLVHLDLSDNHLNGSIPDALGNMTTLAYLDLSWNGLTSSSIYPWLFNLFSTTTSSLVHLDLSYNNLNGSIPDALGNMTTLAYLDLSRNGLTSSSIYPWLFNLFSTSSLVHLDLSYNNLNGSIPNAFGNMTALAYLDLSWNELEGEIPKFFNNISCLVELDLSRNQLHGSNPDAFANMVSLESLDLSENQLEGEMPKSLRDLCNLRRLILSYNNLTGLLEKDFLACSNNTLEALNLSHNRFKGTSFPNLSGFSQLRELYLGFNQLNGTLPESLGQLHQLKVLDISSNSVQGMVSENHLFGLSYLYYLDLSFNSLTFNISLDQVPLFQVYYIKLASCKLGPRFPHWLHTQKSLIELDISASGISDVIPNWLWNSIGYPTWLNVSNNHISGTLPNLTSYPHDLAMDMSSNCLDGSIPQSIFKNAIWLDLSKNRFSGSISLSCKITNQSWWGLSHLDLSSNRLSGELPQCWDQWKDLIVLNLENNNFSGKIKKSIGLLQRMQTLHLRNNNLNGALPSSLKNCRDLHLVDLGKNKLSGRIPSWIGGSLSDLIVLNLRSNEFNGSISLNLCRLRMIQMLDLSSNNLSGTIPKCLKNLTAMAQKRSSIIAYGEISYSFNIFLSYVDNTLVQWKGKELEYKKTLGLIKSIDFSSNKLIGEIPVEVTDLVELVSLNLSRNNLTGPIPPTIGQLKSLDFLDMSQNQLSGGIPSSLAQIARLSVLDLSNNTLSGKIPSGTQLQSFNASTYEGNFGLCGPPLSKSCPKDEDKSGEFSFTGLSSKKDDIQDDANNIWFYGNIVLGFIIGFWGVCGTLLLNDSWRYAYFKFLNKIKDRLYVTTTINTNRLRRSFQS